MSNKLDLNIKQAEGFFRVITLKDEDGDTINLTGHTFLGQVRASPASELFLQFTFALLDQNTYEGQVLVTIDNEITLAKKNILPTSYLYEMIHDDGARAVQILEGVFNFIPGVARL